MTAPEMHCRHCGWSGRPATENVQGVPVSICPNCEWARGLEPVSDALPIDLAKPAYAAEARR